MKVVAVDPIADDLMALSESIRKISPPGTSVECFRNPLFAHQYACLNAVDALYVPAQMRPLTGFDMARVLRKKYPQMFIFFLWHNDDFREDAQRMGADGYIVKPATADALRKALEAAESDAL